MQGDEGFFVLVLGVLAAVLTIVVWWHLGTLAGAGSTTAPEPTPTAEPSPTPTATSSPDPTATATPTLEPEPTVTPLPAATPERSPTAEPTPSGPTAIELERALNELVAAEPIEFTVGSAQLDDSSGPTLARILDLVQSSTADVLVIGHTDDRGDPLQNDELSLERARSIVNHLVANGVEESRLSADGRGGTEPIADNDSDEGRARNRRIEFEVTPPED